MIVRLFILNISIGLVFAQSPDELLNSAKSNLDSGNLAKAESEYNSALEMDPTFAPAYVGLAKVAMRKGDLKQSGSLLKEAIDAMSKNNIVPSLFIDPDIKQIDSTLESGAKCIELHTGTYSDAIDLEHQEMEMSRLKSAAEYASDNKIQVHAGHGLNLSNLSKLCRITQIEEVNIGHSVVADSIFKGLKRAIQDFRSALDND